MPLLSAPERHQLLAEWQVPASWPQPDHECLHQLFEVQAERTPGAVAVAGPGGERLTYAELAHRASRLAHRLRENGVGPEVIVGICAERTVSLVVGLLAILKAGGAYLPLDPAYPGERLRGMLEDSGATHLLVSRSLASFAAGLAAGKVGLFGLDGDEAETHSAPEERGQAVLPGNLAYLIYTSGSTGRPKAVAIEHRNAVALVRWAREAFRPDELEGVLFSTSISFDMSVFEIFAPLAWGGRVIVAESALALPALAPEIDVRLVNTVPSVLAELLRTGPLPASVRTVALGGEALPRALAEKVHATGSVGRLLNLYGPSEDTTYSTFAAITPGEGPLPIGRPIAGGRAHLVGPEMELVPPGVAGELYLGGAGLARGYLGRPELTAERFVPDPFAAEPGARLYRTGDRIRSLPDGDLVFLERLDHQVKVRGFRIEPGEIEAVLAAHPGVRSVAVVTREDLPGGRGLAAWIVAEKDLSVELRGRLRTALPSYMMPAAFVTVQALPLTSSGKLDRRALAAWPLGEAVLAVGTAPRTWSEELLAVLWSQVLGREGIGRDDDFFDLGGHSLLATRMVSRVRAAFGVDLPLRRLFEVPTVAGLAAELEGARRTPSPPLTRAPREGWLPLSFAQQRLWLLDQLDPGSPAYAIPLALRLEGGLSIPALQASLGEVMRRHEVLRTVFAEVEGQPVQKVLDARCLRLPLIDLGGLGEGKREEELARLARQEAETPFDLARGPLFRGHLLGLGPEEHALLLNQHHIVSDGWSLGLVMREGSVLYGAFSSRLPSPLPDLAIQYADFAVWQRRWLSPAIQEDQIAYWRRRLAGLPPLDLPTDRPRRPVRRQRGSIQTATFSAGLSSSLEQLGRGEGATLFMVLLAALQALLSRYSGADDLAVGTPVANRPRLELEELIGFFVNTLVLRGDLAGRPAFRELLVQARETALGAYTHQDFPFEQLVEVLRPERDPSRTPWFQVMMTLQRTPLEDAGLPGLRMTALELGSTSAKFDLTLAFAERGDRLEGVIEYDRDLFDPVTIHRLLGHFERLAAGVVERPETPVAELDLLGPAERGQILGNWAAGAPSPPFRAGVHALVEEVARRRPWSLALAWEGRHLTFGELDGRAGRLARELRRRGVGAESLVGLLLERSPELVVGSLAVLKAGGAYLPLDPAAPRERLALLLREASVSLVLTLDSLRPLLPPLDATRVLSLDLDAGGGYEETGAIEPLRDVEPDHRAYVIYTSGSTGSPKGIEVTHGTLANLVAWSHRAYGMEPHDRTSQTAAPVFDASVLEIWPVLTAGASLHIMPEEERLSPGRMVDWLRAREISVSFLPTPLAETVLALDAVEVPSLRLLTTGGARLHRRPQPGSGFRMLNLYGPTEGTVVTTFAEVSAEGAGIPPIGRPIDGVSIHVLDREGTPVPVGMPGELYIGGGGVARGYLGRPDLTAERFLPDSFAGVPGRRLYRTGDRVRWLPEGELEFIDRLDHQVKVRGYRIELEEIESALLALPGVRQTAVLAQAAGSDPGDLQLVAFVAGEEERAGFLRETLSDLLPPYMVPSRFHLLPDLPLAPSGKIDRRALAALGLSLPRRGGAAGPRDLVELRLVRLWQEVLAIPSVGVDEDFFALGGHSLLAVRLMTAIERETGVRPPLSTLFQAGTIRALARVLRREPGTEPARSLVAVRPHGSRPPVFWIHPAGGGVLCYAGLLQRLDADRPFYALQSKGLNAVGPWATDLPSMAAAYLEEVRALQPSGPYQLGGWSLGGLIAFEMARQLQQEGREIEPLLLLDTHLPDSGLDPERMSPRQLLAALALQLGIEPNGLAAEQEKLDGDAAGQLQPLLERAHDLGAVPVDFGLADLRRIHGVFLANLRAAASYRPQPLEGRIVLFRAGPRGVDPVLWQPLAGGGLEVVNAPGDHYSMLREPHLDPLVSQLREKLSDPGRSAGK